MIKLRFVQSKGISSDLIEYREGVCMPFTPSHVEAVDGGMHIGQRLEGGMQARQAGYDAPFNRELFLDLPATDAQTAAFYAALHACIGEPYDWKSILGFALPGHFHEKYNAICSAKMTQLLRKVEWFPSKLPLCVPFHCIDPRDLLLILSAIVEVPH